MFDLRAWLRRAPKPRKLRLTVDDAERIVDLGTGRCKWAEIEATVLNSKASIVECLDASDAILRSYCLEEESDDPEEAKALSQDKLVARTQSTNAAMLDAYGKRMVEAFSAGAAAAAVSQENLVAIVETLSAHLSLAITNLHTVSVNMANLVQQQGENAGSGGDNKPDAMMGLLTALISGRQLPTPTAPPNGAKKP